LIAPLAELLARHRVLVLTGAGISTESGIPDYRGPTAPKRVRPPMQYKEFVGSEDARRRYWSRSVLGWSRFTSARPAAAHLALTELEKQGRIAGLITQNVDRLHHRAGHQRVVELHGALEDVRCLECDNIVARSSLQTALLAKNPALAGLTAQPIADGDADFEPPSDFAIIPCAVCGGVLKPNVVFFGENVPKKVVESAWATFEEANALLVIGSSLTVFSGYRFVRKAAERGWPIAIVNLGPTRGDDLATIRIDARAGDVVPRLV